jgi:hypothetical protein
LGKLVLAGNRISDLGAEKMVACVHDVELRYLGIYNQSKMTAAGKEALRILHERFMKSRKDNQEKDSKIKRNTFLGFKADPMKVDAKDGTKKYIKEDIEMFI